MPASAMKRSTSQNHFGEHAPQTAQHLRIRATVEDGIKVTLRILYDAISAFLKPVVSVPIATISNEIDIIVATGQQPRYP
jgi:hypothetical protein